MLPSHTITGYRGGPYAKSATGTLVQTGFCSAFSPVVNYSYKIIEFNLASYRQSSLQESFNLDDNELLKNDDGEPNKIE